MFIPRPSNRRIASIYVLLLMLLTGGLDAGKVDWPKRTVEQVELPGPSAIADTSVTHAFKLMRSNRIPICLEYTEQELANYKDGTYNFHPVALRLRVVRAEALERMGDNSGANNLLYALEKDCGKTADPVVAAQTQLVFARVFEKMGMQEETERALAAARFVIQSENLEALRPHYHVRQASYFRVMAAQRDSAFLHAQQAIRWGKETGQAFHQAEGHLVLGLITRNEDFETSVAQFQLSQAAYEKTGDMASVASVLLNLARAHQANGQARSALPFSDSLLRLVDRLERLSVAEPWMRGHSTLTHAAIFHDLGRYDEARRLQLEGTDQLLIYLDEENRQAVLELEARYQNERQELKIEEQRLRLEAESNKQNVLWSIVTGLSLLAVVVGLAYVQLNKRNRQISAALQQEVFLRSEVHHRVKNNLQIIVGLLELQHEAPTNAELGEVLGKLKERIYGMSLLHEMIYQKERAGKIPAGEYAKTLLKHLQGLLPAKSRMEYSIDMPDQTFGLDVLVPLGIIIHELGTNSLKYAQREGQTLKIWLRLEQRNNAWRFSYRDNGPGYAAGEMIEKPSSLGFYLLKTMSAQLGGVLETGNERGAMVNIKFKGDG